MEGSVQTEQALLEELCRLRKRVHELEQLTAGQQSGRERVPSAPAPEELEVAFETLTDAIVVYDTAGSVIRTNSAFYRLIGTTTQPNYLLQTMYEQSSNIHVCDAEGQILPSEQWPISRILQGEVLSGENTTDITLFTLDQREIRVCISGAPLRNEYGHIIGAVANLHDVTEQRKLEQRTYEALAALLAMAEEIVQDANHLQQADTSERLAEAPESSISRTLQRLVELARHILGCRRYSVTRIDPQTEELHLVAVVGASPQEQQRWRSRIDTTCLGDHIANQQILNNIRAGKLTILDLPKRHEIFGAQHYLLVPMRSGSRLIGLLSLDYGNEPHSFSREEMALAEAMSKLTVLVLERAEAQASHLALLEAAHRMDEFLSIASHELRNPLTTINGNLQLAKRHLNLLSLPDNLSADVIDHLDVVQELLSRAQHQVQIQNRLVSDLLDVSRIQANRLHLRLHHCDLIEIVRTTLEDLRAVTPLRTIKLAIAEGATAPIFADGDRISQVVSNYLTNALKYSPAEQPIDVRVEIIDGSARFSVSDKGPGLGLEEQTCLWQRFYRVPGIAAQGSFSVGLGLGLYICRTIIEHHQGEVGVQSMPGQGSTFWLTLPLTI